MPRQTSHIVTVHFGDCDPAGIVFYPNFHRWMDAASLSFFMQRGVLPWHELERTRGIVGTPLLEIHTRFVNASRYPDELVFKTHVETWHRKAFVQKHVVMRGDELICEGEETRIFVVREAGKLRSIAVPDDIRRQCA